MRKINALLLSVLGFLILASLTFGRRTPHHNFTELDWGSTGTTELILPYVSGTDTILYDTTDFYPVAQLVGHSGEDGFWIGIDASKANVAGDAADSLWWRVYLVDFYERSWTTILDTSSSNVIDSADTKQFGYFFSDSLLVHEWVWQNTDSAVVNVKKIGIDRIHKDFWIAVEAFIVEGGDTINTCTTTCGVQSFDNGE